MKLMRDLSGGKPTCGILQAFSYCGRTPSPDNMREWASQALKNGAELIFWYASTGAPIRISLPDVYREKLRISSIIHGMNKLKIPNETKTAIFLSNTSRWGNFDKPIHSYYTVYSILGEQLKTWFRFISDSGLKLKLDDISGYKTVYVPQLKYCDEATAKTLLNYVRNGGRLIIFDPEAFTWNIDGTPLDKIRNELIGCPIGKELDQKNMIAANDSYGLKKGDELPLTPLMHRADAGKIQAFEITPPSDAKVIANYPDGKAAAFEKTVGKGSVIYFASQPFGNSDLAAKDSKWSVFMKGIAEQSGEKTDLPIWDFELPAKGGEIEVNYVIKPDTK
ncbi:MAG: hypothetical protein A2017_16315 [Lentisphaerae bacterium GWF2_44_16]|nr:MAG: hypothetical protein A2017_16315 [Lentisphaerae bacterium GWF2_44_16]